MTVQTLAALSENLCVQAIERLGREATGRAIHEYVSAKVSSKELYLMVETYVTLDRLEKSGKVKYAGEDHEEVAGIYQLAS